MTDVTASVQQYYGEVLSSSQDLRTSACCAAEAPPAHVREAIGNVHPEVLERFYGCGSPVPPALEGATILDLGCGTGRDVYVLAQFAGSTGRVIGVDMTPEQLEVAERHKAWHAERFGFDTAEFHEGRIEDLGSLGIADDSVDLVISNCVLNLATDKSTVFREIFRVLKPGGELYFSDVFADRRIPAELADDPVLRGECLGGAMYWEDFRRLMHEVGCPDPRVTERAPIAIEDAEIERQIGFAAFESVTVRAFKLPLEDRCEDYGQVATYRGTMAEHPHAFDLDDHHRLERGRPMLVCGNTADMLAGTRYARHFDVVGEKRTHFGLFPCGPEASASTPSDSAGGACC